MTLIQDQIQNQEAGTPKRILISEAVLSYIVIGCENLPHAIDYQVTVTLAAEDHNTRCVIEALTGYMPPEFDQFQVFDPKSGKLTPVDDGPGEQALPLVFSSADGKYAMGVFSQEPEAPRDAHGPTYGRWRMKDFRVVKWNCVFRLQNSAGLTGDYNCHVFVVVGSLEDVRTTLVALQKSLTLPNTTLEPTASPASAPGLSQSGTCKFASRGSAFGR